MSEPRISVEEVIAAYQETGMLPRPSGLFVRITEYQNAGCALGAIAVHRAGTADYCRLEEWYPGAYVSAFASGFDSCLHGKVEVRWESLQTLELLSTYPRMVEGFWDGVAAGDAVKDGVPSPVPDYPPVVEELVTA